MIFHDSSHPLQDLPDQACLVVLIVHRALQSLPAHIHQNLVVPANRVSQAKYLQVLLLLVEQLSDMR